MKKLTCLLFTLLCCVPILSAQPKGFAIHLVGDTLLARMKGRSYPSNCDVKVSDLRYLTVLHYDDRGVVRKGELVCNKAIAQDLLDIFIALYEAKYPIQRIALIDEYGGDDNKSMEDNNTSCFNYRLVGGTRKLSKHARGLAIDINPMYNPFVHYRNGKRLIEPQSGAEWAVKRNASQNKMIITRDDLCYKLFTKHGFRWGGNWRSMKDYQHFEK